MTDTDTTTEDAADDTSADRIEFVDFHRPPLTDGDYEITVSHVVSAEGITANGTFSPTDPIRFTVQGPRFVLKPTDVHAVYPPDGSVGDHSSVLAHVVFDRSTLPWDRKPAGADLPWLAVVLLDETDFTAGLAAQHDPMSLGDLKSLADNPQPGQPHVPPFEKETGDLDEDRIAVIDIAKSLLVQLLAGAADSLSGVELQQHVRERSHFQFDTGGPFDESTGLDATTTRVRSEFITHGHDVGDKSVLSRGVGDGRWTLTDPDSGSTWVIKTEPGGSATVWDPAVAVVYGSRLPRPSARSTAHLVSIETLHGNESTIDALAPEAMVRLVSLKSWSFQCTDDDATFEGILQAVDVAPYTLPADAIGGNEPASGLPGDSPARKFVSAGFVPLHHRLRGGQQTFSLYRGPLVPTIETDRLAEPVSTSDALLRFDRDNGVFDASYSAAWELGRLLALQSRSISTALFTWKRAHRLGQHGADQAVAHLSGLTPDDTAAADSTELPTAVTSWFSGLHLLKGVPFNYLVPDERLLPRESIRFFRLDERWLDCLVDGAFAVGRVLSTDHDHDKNLRKGQLTSRLTPGGGVSGFLLRSAVVPGWPGMKVSGYAGTDRLPGVRFDRLSDNVLICLFSGQVTTVELSLKPETLHFGFDRVAGTSGASVRYQKTIRLPQSEPLDTTTPRTASIDVMLSAGRIADLGALASEIGEQPGLPDLLGPARFALELIEPSPIVTFAPKP